MDNQNARSFLQVLVKNKPYKILQRKDSTLLERLTGVSFHA
jgi:hypothetical protein